MHALQHIKGRLGSIRTNELEVFRGFVCLFDFFVIGLHFQLSEIPSLCVLGTVFIEINYLPFWPGGMK